MNLRSDGLRFARNDSQRIEAKVRKSVIGVCITQKLDYLGRLSIIVLLW